MDQWNRKLCSERNREERHPMNYEEPYIGIESFAEEEDIITASGLEAVPAEPDDDTIHFGWGS